MQKIKIQSTDKQRDYYSLDCEHSDVLREDKYTDSKIQLSNLCYIKKTLSFMLHSLNIECFKLQKSQWSTLQETTPE